ncbi:hypothetical protein KSZ_49770 [Dictyobacter formicarum]|uniref:Uncharacterized protein n=1 Tax=Dictyobacter formicarum TaxID=2778368 RepID=A0ABQ3VPF0_9CHLR|nr:hypothetical protein KSZ_49770 [Dictyobacter formicarum]
MQAEQNKEDYGIHRIDIHLLQHRLGAGIEPYACSKGATVGSDPPEAPDRDKTYPHQEESV